MPLGPTTPSVLNLAEPLFSSHLLDLLVYWFLFCWFTFWLHAWPFLYMCFTFSSMKFMSFFFVLNEFPVRALTLQNRVFWRGGCAWFYTSENMIVHDVPYLFRYLFRHWFSVSLGIDLGSILASLWNRIWMIFKWCLGDVWMMFTWWLDDIFKIFHFETNTDPMCKKQQQGLSNAQFRIKLAYK